MILFPPVTSFREAPKILIYGYHHILSMDSSGQAILRSNWPGAG